MLRKTTTAGAALAPRAIASMRPQRNAAENATLSAICCSHDDASMRPQRNAAENGVQVTSIRFPSLGFNEAAA